LCFTEIFVFLQSVVLKARYCLYTQTLAVILKRIVEKTRMIKLLNKYKFKIIYIVILSLLLFVFVPNQEDYYLDNDIINFKDKFYWKTSFIVIGIIAFLFFIKLAIKKVALEEKLNKVFASIIIGFLFAVFFQPIIISSFLYINRCEKVNSITEKYKIMYIEGNDLIAYNKKNKETIFARDFNKFLIKTNINTLKINDTLKLNFEKGLFGIKYIEK
jgi:hypothetical protein